MNKIIILFLALIVLCVYVQNDAFANDDWQYWSTITVNHALSEREDLSLLYEIYAKENMSDDYVYLAIPTYKRNVGHGFSIIGGGYFESIQKTKTQWNNVRSILLGPVYQYIPWDKWSIVSQIKLYYQLAPNAEWDYYRPRVSIQHAFESWTLSAEDEMRVDLTGERNADFYRNRVFVTGKKKFNSSLTLGIGYICQSDRVSDNWSSIHALHTVISYHY